MKTEYKLRYKCVNIKTIINKNIIYIYLIAQFFLVDIQIFIKMQLHI